MHVSLKGAAGFLASLLAAACATPAPETVAPARFDEAIGAFEAADASANPPPCATLFVGASSIRFWNTLKDDFPDRIVINRGFGGSTVAEVNLYFDRVVTPYKPSEIVFYAGENDLNAGKTPTQVLADFEGFMRLKTRALGKTPVWYISAKPSILRRDQLAAQTDLNARIKTLAAARDDLAFIDVVAAMQNPDGSPKDIFVADNLHMTPAGYALWTPIVDAALDAGQSAKAPGCG
ncbi:MAG: GDSL-type esterase/lipase family protein [Alphaproteobacteria bacterium]|nr:GDSL-type esterase/lipase family protein [Alphaproteobacteria bacterium]